MALAIFGLCAETEAHGRGGDHGGAPDAAKEGEKACGWGNSRGIVNHRRWGRFPGTAARFSQRPTQARIIARKSLNLPPRQITI